MRRQRDPIHRRVPAGRPDRRHDPTLRATPPTLSTTTSARRVLLTGATGYVGGRLLPELERRGVALTCLVRRPEALAGLAAATTRIVVGDVLDPAALGPALAGIDTAYYLVHSLEAGEDFARRDREAATSFGAAARVGGVRRIVYVGGLGDADSPNLSEHLKSRRQTGDTLRASGVPVVEFRASIVLGAGSLSFEMIRALVERLPVMVCPRWVSVLAQPLAIDDLVAYLLAALDLPDGESRVYEIGGPDQVSYGDLMREYSRERGLARLLIPVPFLTPRLSSLWLALVTPLYARVGRTLIEGLKNPTVVRDPAALRDFSIRPRGVKAATALAVAEETRRAARDRAGTGGFVLERTQKVVATRREVFAFYADPSNLSRLTPPGLRFRIHGETPPRLEAGSRLEYRIRWLFLRIPWVTRITRWVPESEFEDVQERGPYRTWIHTHFFEEDDNGVIVRDRVEYSLPFGPIGRLAHRLLVRRQLEAIFDFRRRAIEELFPNR
ncbi:MAG: NAD(P)H-binding protein [Acidobacteriota bacterium]